MVLNLQSLLQRANAIAKNATLQTKTLNNQFFFPNEGTWPTLTNSIDPNMRLVSRWRTVTGSGLNICNENFGGILHCFISEIRDITKHRSSKRLPGSARSMRWRPDAPKPTTCTRPKAPAAAFLGIGMVGFFAIGLREVEEASMPEGKNLKKESHRTEQQVHQLELFDFGPCPRWHILIRLKVRGCELVALMVNSFVVFVVGLQQLQHKMHICSSAKMR